MLMLGREVTMPVDLVFPGPEPIDDLDYEDYLTKLVKHIQTAHEIARDKLKTSQSVSKRDYDLKAFTRSFCRGDAVYVLDTAVPKGKCAKLRPQWKGPGLVVRKITDFLYEVWLRKKLETINHDRMKPCNDRNLPKWLLKQRQDIDAGTQDLASKDTGKDGLYCLCRGPYDGKFMIQCDECLEWYHGTCVQVTSEEAKSIDVYLCPDCTNV